VISRTFCAPHVGRVGAVLLNSNLLGASRTRGSSFTMCDYSLHHVKSRPANIGEKLITRNFNTGTRGFASPDDRTTAVCILPGTELAFSADVKWAPFSLLSRRVKVI